MSHASRVRTYEPSASVVFLKTNELFGGLSNMAAGFPLRVNGVRIRTSEALYQACRFPHLPDVQRKIIDEHSPMTAKMRGKPFRKDSRPDWDAVRVKIMRWCLRVKLAQNWREFGRLLLATGNHPIVEQSRKDDFWGAKVADDGTLVGMNVLGRLLMELREQLKGNEAESLRFIEPLAISEFLLFGQHIEAVQADPNAEIPGWIPRRLSQADVAPVATSLSGAQHSLFEQPVITDTKPRDAIPQVENVGRRKAPTRFPRYRESGLPWLGEIPEHWDVRRNGRLFAERVDTGHEELPILEVSLRTGVRVRDMENGTRKQQMTDRSKYKRAAKGDIAYNMMRMWQGAVGVAPVNGLISPAYVVARPFAETEPRYYAYLFRTDAYKREVNKFSRGIVSDRNRLYWDEFKQMPSVFPPMEEQRRIADFLDAHGRLTARLIRNKRRLIGLLNEQKQAIINRAVTRGLNLHAPMKPTGVDWMPEVPMHWDVRMLSRLAAKLQTGPFGSQLHQADYVEDGVPVINPMHLIDGSIRPDRETTVNAQTAKRLVRHELVPGEIVIARRGELGRCALVREFDGPMLCGTGCMTLRLSEGIPRFYFEFLSSASVRRFLDERSIGATMQNLNPSIIGSIQTVVPPENEQEAIIRAIEDTNSTFASLESKAQDEIRLVREYRERLIADVVIGKLDVRHVEIAAPADEPVADEDDALEELEGDDTEVIERADADD
jgi:type I restriction enzyme S subunit